ncbi:MAG: type II/IV secretion system protein [Desulfotomaculum sp.]|nr:type II/IV secretion system protein [Desulfotomaculum sp.]
MFDAGEKKLGRLLLASNIITPEQLDLALSEQRKNGGKLGQVLVKLQFISELDLINVLERKLHIPRAVIPPRVPEEVLHLISEVFMRRYKVFPIKTEGRELTVAMADPLNMVVIDELRQMTRKEIKPVLALEQQITAAVTRHFEVLQLEQELSQQDQKHEDANAFSSNLEGEESAVIRLVNSILNQGIADRASDIHIEPQDDCVLVRERVDGILKVMMFLPKGVLNSLVSRVKIMADLDIAVKRLPQDGRIQLSDRDKKIDLRISTMPTIFGEKIVIRILQKNSELIDINQLGFSDYNFRTFKNIIRSTSGMVLITGPTGSGKTTTLYAVLSELNSPAKNIISVEDPVEYVIKGINQIQVNKKAGLTFAVGLKYILRQDPDVIMVGEIRDSETAKIAVRAASTGHLVLSTMHTSDAAEALTRLVDMGIEPYLVASSVVAVIAQRLVRKICFHCAETYNGSYSRGRGCSLCGNSGYMGRMGIHEILVVDHQIKELINNKADSKRIKRLGIKNGMVPLKEDGLLKARQCQTTPDEIFKAAYSILEK